MKVHYCLPTYNQPQLLRRAVEAALASDIELAEVTVVDLSPEHVAFANKLARRGGLENVAFLERDFESIREGELPQLDYICAHGFLSWVSTQKRRAFIDFCARQLKPGGLLFVAYNALPGWAALAPLRPATACERRSPALSCPAVVNSRAPT